MEPIKTLGTILKHEPQRDAIHIAVAPVIASEQLSPGQHVALVAGEAVTNGDHIGVIDPYLTAPVSKGERCWLFLYPNTITSLRHEWIHPAFEAGRLSRADHIAISQKWISDHATLLGLTEDVLMENARSWLDWEDYIVQRGSERWRDNFNATEFWHHYEVVTGTVVNEEKKQSFYCCSC